MGMGFGDMEAGSKSGVPSWGLQHFLGVNIGSPYSWTPPRLDPRTLKKSEADTVARDSQVIRFRVYGICGPWHRNVRSLSSTVVKARWIRLSVGNEVKVSPSYLVT